MSESLEIEVEYTAEDFATTARHVLRRRRLFQRTIAPILIISILVFLSLVLLNPLKAFSDFMSPRMLAILTLLALVVFAIYLMRRRKYSLLTRHSYRKAIEADKFLQGTRTIRFTRSGIQGIHSLSSGEVYWHAFVEIQETEGYFYFYTTEQAAQVVPKRDFSREGLVKLREILSENLPDGVVLDLMV